MNLSLYENLFLSAAVAAYLAAMLFLWSQMFFHADDISARMERGHAVAGKWGGALLLCGALLHAVALAGQGAALFSVRVGVAGLFGWILAVLYLLLGKRLASSRGNSLGAFVAPVVLFAAMYSLFDPSLHQAARPETLEKPWLVVHVALIALSYSVLSIAFAASLIYFWQERLLKRKQLAGLWQRLPPLSVADEWTYRATTFGLSALTLGMIVGVVWMARHQHAYEIWSDPKVLLTSATWTLFALYLAARWWLGWRGRRTNMVVIYGFVLLVISFLGAPHVLNGIPR
ncbi:MAG TPA: cytochrome c biogenesis protein CcsA [Abditibacteriaceae bacterium]|jgi:ABC-type uncharacterized transport system permease subunit